LDDIPQTLAGFLVVLVLFVSAGPAGAVETETVEVESFDGTEIDVLVCQPDAASASNPVPVVVHSHGWGGSRADDCSRFSAYLDAGFGVASVSQRGFGASGGKAHGMDPDVEGRDNVAVVDHLAGLDWVAKDAPGDPVLGAIGASYGGAFQLVTAFVETADPTIAGPGETRFDALAPQITWHDLVRLLAPNDVVKSKWADALYAAGHDNVHAGVHEAFAYATATGQLPDGTVPGVYDLKSDFEQSGPSWFVDQGYRLDVPVLVRQGLGDTLAPLNHAWHNVEDALTADARANSTVIGHNGGHALPKLFPPGVTGGSDPCTRETGAGSFTRLTIDFLGQAFEGEPARPTEAGYNVATVDDTCLHVDTLAPTRTASTGPVAVSTGASAPVFVEIAEGPITLAGIPTVDAELTAGGVDQRAFVGLAVGENRTDARVLEQATTPVRSPTPRLVEDVEVELPGMAARVDADEHVYLAVMGFDDTYAHHGSRAPGAVALTDVEVGLPVVGK
jgi:hypothetical protein